MRTGWSALKDTHGHLIAAIEQDPTLPAPLKRHVITVIRQDRREAAGTPLLHRVGRVSVLRLYSRILGQESDNRSLGRLVSELIRGLRALGMWKPGRIQPAGGNGKGAIFDSHPRRTRKRGPAIFQPRGPSDLPAEPAPDHDAAGAPVPMIGTDERDPDDTRADDGVEVDRADT